MRVNVLRELAKGVKHLYALATSLGEHFSTVHETLESFKNAGIIEVEACGSREAVYYGLTPLGRRILALLDWVEAQGPIEPPELKRVFGEEVVSTAVNANLLEPRVERIKQVRLILDAPPGISKEGSWLKCTKCGEYVDTTRKPDLVKCPSCDTEYRKKTELSGVPWWAYLLSLFGGGFLGAALDNEDRWRGAAVGAVVPTAVTAVVDGFLRLSLEEVSYEPNLG